MKKIILTLFISSLLGGDLKSQTIPNADPVGQFNFPSRKKLHFYYDANGNRTKRMIRVILCDGLEEGDDIDIPPNEEIASQENQPKQKSSAVSLGVNVYPNPAKERIHITIHSEETLKTGYLTLYDLQGRVLYNKSNLVNATLEIIDLEKLSVGTYVLKVNINEQWFQYKIIKEN